MKAKTAVALALTTVAVVLGLATLEIYGARSAKATAGGATAGATGWQDRQVFNWCEARLSLSLSDAHNPPNGGVCVGFTACASAYGRIYLYVVVTASSQPTQGIIVRILTVNTQKTMAKLTSFPVVRGTHPLEEECKSTRPRRTK